MAVSIHFITQSADSVIGKVVVKRRHPVDNAGRRQFDDAVGNGIDKLVVVGVEENDAGEIFERVVKSGD